MTVVEAYKMFMQEQHFRGNSTETISYYNITLNMFIDFCGQDLDIDDLDVFLFKSYQLHLLSKKNLKRVSIRRVFERVKFL